MFLCYTFCNDLTVFWITNKQTWKPVKFAVGHRRGSDRTWCRRVKRCQSCSAQENTVLLEGRSLWCRPASSLYNWGRCKLPPENLRQIHWCMNLRSMWLTVSSDEMRDSKEVEAVPQKWERTLLFIFWRELFFQTTWSTCCCFKKCLDCTLRCLHFLHKLVGTFR